MDKIYTARRVGMTGSGCMWQIAGPRSHLVITTRGHGPRTDVYACDIDGKPVGDAPKPLVSLPRHDYQGAVDLYLESLNSEPAVNERILIVEPCTSAGDPDPNYWPTVDADPSQIVLVEVIDHAGDLDAATMVSAIVGTFTTRIYPFSASDPARRFAESTTASGSRSAIIYARKVNDPESNEFVDGEISEPVAAPRMVH
jgi:hypothetical protein